MLAQKWKSGMGVRAINYCFDEELNLFVSMMVLVGDLTGDYIGLKSHGSKGGTCRRWVLQPDDYIKDI